MSRRDDRTYLQHMLDHASEAVSMAEGKTRDDLNRERQLHLSLIKLVEIVGEAANRVCELTRRQHPSVPWAEIVGLRNRLVHGYDEVDLDILWDIVRYDLPLLASELARILASTDESSGTSS
jgi:uncharacterized protein with HEPN domain